MVYFVTAIGTDSGKTLVSAILCEALHADYWKPVQSGLPRDTETVASLISNDQSKMHKERYLLNTPASPHYAAQVDGVKIEIANFKLPDFQNNLVIEGAGGCLVPLNEKDFVIDFAAKFADKIVLVSNLYLGSINHTLLTAHYLKQRGLPVAGIIFNGEPNSASEDIILQHTGYRCLMRINKEPVINKAVVKTYAQILKQQL